MICDHLKELCYSRGAEDNLTAVIVRTFAEPDDVVEDFDSTVPVIEEETVATARSASAFAGAEAVIPVAPLIADTMPQIDLEEVETGDLELPAEDARSGEEEPLEEEPLTEEVVAPEETPRIVEPLPEPPTDEQFLLIEDDEAPPTAPDENLSSYTSSSVVVPAQSNPSGSDFQIFGNQGAAVYEEPAQSKSGVTRILFSLGLLLLGAAIAVAITYFLGLGGQDQPVADAPQVETMKTQNIPLTSFEEARRMVDKDPAAYASRTATPSDAADFYLLGRALLLTGKAAEAKRQLELARERLPQVDEPERKTLGNEIVFALAAIDNPEALKNLTASAQTAGTANSNSLIP